MEIWIGAPPPRQAATWPPRDPVPRFLSSLALVVVGFLLAVWWMDRADCPAPSPMASGPVEVYMVEEDADPEPGPVMRPEEPIVVTAKGEPEAEPVPEWMAHPERVVVPPERPVAACGYGEWALGLCSR